MLENPSHGSSAAATTANLIKRYAPPNQRNRTLSRRKSGDRFERTNNFHVNDGEKNQVVTSRNVSPGDHGDTGSNNIQSDNPRMGLIALDGCSSSEASQLLIKRWTAAMQCYNNSSIDLSERPVLYSGSSASAWGHFRLPHQLMPPTVSVGPSPASQMDFLVELQRSMRNASTTSSSTLTLPLR